MGRIILEFDSIEEAQDARDAINVSNYKAVLWDLDASLRATTKYGTSFTNPNQEATSEEIEIIEKVRERLHELLSEYNVKID